MMDQHTSVVFSSDSMMKLLVLAAFIGVCAGGALPGYIPPQYRYDPSQYYNGNYRAGLERNAAILRSESEVTDQGFRYLYETENGIRAEASGVENKGIQSQGSFSYTGTDGQQYGVTYTADANGFQPQGAHLPTPPPIPDAIVKSIEENARAEAAGIYNEGSYHHSYNPSEQAAKDYYKYYNNRRYLSPAFGRYPY